MRKGSASELWTYERIEGANGAALRDLDDDPRRPRMPDTKEVEVLAEDLVDVLGNI